MGVLDVLSTDERSVLHVRASWTAAILKANGTRPKCASLSNDGLTRQ